MKIVANIIGSNKYKDRLQILANGGIRCEEHDIKVRIIGEGCRPEIIPQNWEWIDWSNVRVADRHIRFIAKEGLDSDCDFHLFCDDDSATNIDHMVRHALKTNPIDEPCVWTPALGEFCHQHWFDALTKSVGSLMPKKSRNSLWIGYEAALINKKLAYLMSKSEMADRVLSFSSYLNGTTTLSNTPCDIQISVLSWLLDANHVGSSRSMAHQHPHYLDYSGLTSDGLLWHIHGVGRQETTNKKNVANALKHGPFKSKEELVGALFPKLSFGIKAKNLSATKFSLGMFFATWIGGGIIRAKLPVSFTFKDKSFGDVVWNGVPSTWESCNDGFLVKTGGDTYKFCWQMSDGYVGYLQHSTVYDTTKHSTMMCLFFESP
jgi:hypothetical protein